MIGTAPPNALDAPAFRFRALAMLAGRALIGGEREVALAALMAARLAIAVLPPHPISATARASRAAGARVWFSTLTLPAATRAPMATLVDATEGSDPARIGAALTDVARVVGAHLDVASRAELTQVVKALTAG